MCKVTLSQVVAAALSTPGGVPQKSNTFSGKGRINVAQDGELMRCKVSTSKTNSAVDRMSCVEVHSYRVCVKAKSL